VKPQASKTDGRRAPPISTLIIVVCCALLAAGCATETRYKWLSRFFDGVPAPGAAPAQATNPDEQIVPADSNVVLVASTAPVAIPHTFHPPFHDQTCTECHESKFSQKMKGPMNTVCFACHDDFLEKAKVKHAPAESGECTSCHDPHESPNKKLLLRVGAALCFDCHEADDVAKVAAHKVAADRDNCIACHDPHASQNQKLLKAAALKAPAPQPPESLPAPSAK
jgi:predicted CXXCH cytochrome family protein